MGGGTEKQEGKIFMKLMSIIACAGALGVLAACAQQEEMVMVEPQPMFDKYGGGSCEGDFIYIPGTVPEEAKCVPPDECEPVHDTAGTIIDCPPPHRDPGGSSSGGRTPGASRGSTGRT